VTSFQLVRPPAAGVAPLQPDAAQQRIIDHDRGVLRVLAGPGTGKTRTLVEAAANRVDRGVAVSELLLLTFSRRAAGQLRDQLTSRLQRTIAEPVARTFHSYAFGLVRRAAVLRGDPPPRLLSGSEQDVTLRELLAGRLADGRDSWPAELSAAVRTRAFGDELRELLMRAIERDIDPAHLAALGRRHDRPDWVVAARIYTEYQQVTALQAPGAFDAAELIQRAVTELVDNPQLLQAERQQRRRIFVDEYQDSDPAQLQLLKLIADGADELVLFGDPDQAIYAFRGAEHNAMAEIDSHFGLLGDLGVRAEPPGGQLELSAPIETVALTGSRRLGAELLAASRRVADRLSGPGQHRRLRPDRDRPPGQVAVAVFGSASHEAARIAATLRRAHLESGVPWSEMAVLVRAAGPAADTLRRGLASAGVPVGQPVQGALTDEPVVSLLLDLLRCVTDPDTVTPVLAEALLVSTVGRADPLQILRMQRALRRVGDGPASLADLVVSPVAVGFLPESVRAPALRVLQVVEAGRSALGTGASAEDVLWAVWQASGLAPRLHRRSLDPSAPADASRAERALDAVLALFAEAAKVSDRSPGAGARELREWVSQLQITDAETARRQPALDEVAIITAHASKGLQWRVVCVAGVQEGSWPNLRRQGSLLGADLLVDLHAHRPEVSSGQLPERLMAERRLFYVAITRAQEQLLVTAVANEETQPSRFLDELDPQPEAEPDRAIDSARRRFELPGLVAELRAVLAAADGTVDTRLTEAAAAQLARLAAAGVPGAAPETWWGLAPLSTDRPIRDPARGPVPIRPSKFEAYLDCQLRALLLELGAADAEEQTAAELGTLIHQIAERAADGAELATLMGWLEQSWGQLDFGAAWHADNERVRAEAMLSELAGWLRESRAGLSLVEREATFSVTIGDAKLVGTVDRLERDARGRLVVVDFKTGKNRYSEKDLPQHPQLAAYQLAVTEGGFTDGRPAEPGGAQLVQLGKPNGRSGISQVQQPLTEQEDPDWVQAELAGIARALRGAVVLARPGKSCDRCPVRSSCPVHDDGRQVPQ